MKHERHSIPSAIRSNCFQLSTVLLRFRTKNASSSSLIKAVDVGGGVEIAFVGAPGDDGGAVEATRARGLGRGRGRVDIAVFRQAAIVGTLRARVDVIPRDRDRDNERPLSSAILSLA